MRINSLNTSFTAGISRNWDGSTTKSRKDIVKSYDEAIAKIEHKKMQAIELDEFISSKDVQAVIARLPRKDLVNINHPPYIDEFYSSDTKPTLEYIPRSSSSIKKAFYSSVNPHQLNTLKFKSTYKEDGTLNKEGIVGWLEYLREFFQ